MRIQNFSCKQVHGYLNLELDLNHDLNFILGINGSGKTTIMDLIDSILALNFYRVFQYEYESVLLTISHDETIFNINLTKTNKDYVVQVNELKKCSIPLSIFQAMDDEEEFATFFKSNFLENETIIQLRNLPRVKFLNLDREMSNEDLIDMKSNIPSPRRTFFDRQRMSALRISRGMNFEDSLVLIREIHTRTRLAIENLDDRLKKDLIRLTLKTFKNELKSPEDLNRIKKEIEEVCISFRKNQNDFMSIFNYLINNNEEKSSSEADQFLIETEQFIKKVESVSNEKGEEGSINIELLIQYNSIIRIKEMEKIIKEYKRKKELATRKIEEFTTTINSFFRHNGKEISIDNVGKLNFRYEGRDLPKKKRIRFSSGETHLIMIFALLILEDKKLKENNVLIIDEPELSLHLHWQEMFIENILRINSNIQYIFATHSPTIVGEYGDHVVQIKKNN